MIINMAASRHLIGHHNDGGPYRTMYGPWAYGTMAMAVSTLAVSLSLCAHDDVQAKRITMNQLPDDSTIKGNLLSTNESTIEHDTTLNGTQVLGNHSASGQSDSISVSKTSESSEQIEDLLAKLSLNSVNIEVDSQKEVPKSDVDNQSLSVSSISDDKTLVGTQSLKSGQSDSSKPSEKLEDLLGKMSLDSVKVEVALDPIGLANLKPSNEGATDAMSDKTVIYGHDGQADENIVENIVENTDTHKNSKKKDNTKPAPQDPGPHKSTPKGQSQLRCNNKRGNHAEIDEPQNNLLNAPQSMNQPQAKSDSIQEVWKRNINPLMTEVIRNAERTFTLFIFTK